MKLKIFVGFLILIASLFAFIILEHDEQTGIPFDYDEILAMDFVENYPQNPYALITEYNRLIRALYSGYIEYNQINMLVQKQRDLFSTELLELNPQDIHLDGIISEIDTFRQKGVYIVTTEIEEINYDGNNICVVVVTNYTNAEQDIRITYYLIKNDDGDWKILSFEGVFI